MQATISRESIAWVVGLCALGGSILAATQLDVFGVPNPSVLASAHAADVPPDAATPLADSALEWEPAYGVSGTGEPAPRASVDMPGNPAAAPPQLLAATASVVGGDPAQTAARRASHLPARARSTTDAGRVHATAPTVATLAAPALASAERSPATISASPTSARASGPGPSTATTFASSLDNGPTSASAPTFLIPTSSGSPGSRSLPAGPTPIAPSPTGGSTAAPATRPTTSTPSRTSAPIVFVPPTTLAGLVVRAPTSSGTTPLPMLSKSFAVGNAGTVVLQMQGSTLVLVAAIPMAGVVAVVDLDDGQTVAVTFFVPGGAGHATFTAAISGMQITYQIRG